jgi:hypothetical protein
VDDPFGLAIAHAVAVQALDMGVVERVGRGLLAAWQQVEDSDEAAFRLTAGDCRRSSRAVVAAAAVIGTLMTAILEWTNDPNARPLGDAVTVARALLEIGAPR